MASAEGAAKLPLIGLATDQERDLAGQALAPALATLLPEPEAPVSKEVFSDKSFA
jgi:hypothetical protein